VVFFSSLFFLFSGLEFLEQGENSFYTCRKDIKLFDGNDIPPVWHHSLIIKKGGRDGAQKEMELETEPVVTHGARRRRRR